ncbi:MAG: DsrE family protein [Dehalococcoidia bacterium]
MATLLYHSTHGSDDPTRASFPYVAANGAVQAGHTAEVFLTGEAVYLMKKPVADAVVPVGWPPLKDLLRTAIDGGVTTYV